MIKHRIRRARAAALALLFPLSLLPVGLAQTAIGQTIDNEQGFTLARVRPIPSLFQEYVENADSPSGTVEVSHASAIGSPADRRSVFQFDLSQITTGSTLETVYLRLYVASTLGNRSNFDVDLYGRNLLREPLHAEDLANEDVAFGEYSDGYSLVQSGVLTSATFENAWVEIDVTDFVAGAYAQYMHASATNPETENSFLFFRLQGDGLPFGQGGVDGGFRIASQGHLENAELVVIPEAQTLALVFSCAVVGLLISRRRYR